MFKEMMEDMEETERYHKMMWLVEATYGDYAFYPARDFDNVVALTLKDIPDSRYLSDCCRVSRRLLQWVHPDRPGSEAMSSSRFLMYR